MDCCVGFGVVVAVAVTTHSIWLDSGFWPIFKLILQLLESKRAPPQFGDFCRHIFCLDHWQARRTKNGIGLTSELDSEVGSEGFQRIIIAKITFVLVRIHQPLLIRPEERRLGKGWLGSCRSGWTPVH